MKIRHCNGLERKPGMLPEKLLVVLLVLTPVIGALLLGCGIDLLAREPGIAVAELLVGIFLLWGGIAQFQCAMADFTFSEEGVTVKYPLGRTRRMPWTDFQEVCVCYRSYATEMYGYSTICLVRKGERKDLFGRWKTSSPFRCHRIFCLDYSDELLETVRKNCPYAVPDLRDKGNYRL